MELEIHFLNWRKWQGRGTEHEKTTWFKVSNDIMNHELWDNLNGSQFKIFIGLLSETSKKDPQNGRVLLTAKRVLRQISCRMSSVLQTLCILKKMGIVEYQVFNCPRRIVEGSEEDPRSEKNRIDKNKKGKGTPLFLFKNGEESGKKIPEDARAFLDKIKRDSVLPEIEE